MLVMVPGILMLVIKLKSQRAYSPSATTGKPLCTGGITMSASLDSPMSVRI